MAEPNWANQTIWTGDNLPIMRGMNSESVDLIYLDPPFNSKANYAAPIGSKAAGAEFKDTWRLDDVEVEWIDVIEDKHPDLRRVLLAAMVDSDKAYLAYMAIRLLEMKRILKPTGSIYLHCDPTMSHYLKLVMDSIFGRRTFRNEIIWGYTGPGSPKMKQFNRKHDVLFWYVKGDSWTFNKDDIRVSHKDGGPHTGGFLNELDTSSSEKYGIKGKIPETWWVQEPGNGLAIAARQKKQYVGYPTQKPLALLNRIIKASSNKGDIILDPFCGCATACVAAEQLQRNWVGIDISSKAAELITMRFHEEIGGLAYKGTHRKDLPRRTDMGKLPKYNCVENRTWLYGKQEGHCNGCVEYFSSKNLTVDHVIPRSKGGTDHIENLQLLCGYCNSTKGNRDMSYLRKRLKMFQTDTKPKRKGWGLEKQEEFK